MQYKNSWISPPSPPPEKKNEKLKHTNCRLMRPVPIFFALTGARYLDCCVLIGEHDPDHRYGDLEAATRLYVAPGFVESLAGEGGRGGEMGRG